jgi:hypothetical protein
MVTATGQNRPSSIVIPTVMPIVTPTATLIVALTVTMLIKRPLKYSFIRIKTIY